MQKIVKILLVIFLLLSVTIVIIGYGYWKKEKKDMENNTPKEYNGQEIGNNSNADEKLTEQIEGKGQKEDITEDKGKGQPELQIDPEKIKPNEAGKIMVVMFHNFVETFTATKYGNGEYTMTFQAFEELLYKLYDKGYRLISLKDYLENNISIPAGYIPMVFTFDDGTSGQFNLVEEDGVLKANRKSAVGIMEEFCSKYPDFGLKGTFFVNLGLSVFSGKGTLPERLKYLIDKGFEIGNHTLSHVDLTTIKSIEKIRQEVGGNQKKMYELVPGYKMFAFSLPYGALPNDLMEYVISGEYEGEKYENLAIMEVGWDPALSPVNKNFNPYSIHRIRAPGINPVKFDLNWWLENLSREDEFISDGNPDTITVPGSKAENIDIGKLNDKELVVYDN